MLDRVTAKSGQPSYGELDDQVWFIYSTLLYASAEYSNYRLCSQLPEASRWLHSRGAQLSDECLLLSRCDAADGPALAVPAPHGQYEGGEGNQSAVGAGGGRLGRVPAGAAVPEAAHTATSQVRTR